MARTEHFIGLEWLRFLLAIYVVLFHTVHAYVEDEPTWLSELAGVGFFATSSFFVLSGFLLAHVYCRQGELREPARHFLGKRLANLYPLHLFSLLLTAIVLTIIAKLGIPPDDAKASLRYVVYDTNEELSGEARDALEYFMNNRELAFNFILQLLMLHAWNPLYLTFNPPLWSISTLFFFYLCFPLLAPRLMRLRHKGWWLLAIAALYLLPPLWAIQQDAYGIPVTGMLHRMPLLRLPEFLAGILLCGLFREWRAAGGQLGIAARLALGAFVLASFLATVWLLKGERYWYFLLHNGLLLPAQLALVWLCALIATPRSAAVVGWSQRLGAASLPLFVLHVPVFILFSRSEKLLGAVSAECLEDWADCMAQAGELALTPAFYPLYLGLCIVVCVLAQERAVVPVRQFLLRRVLKV